MVKRYETYSEIPANVHSFICNVAGIETIYKLTIKEINDFLVDLENYYEEQNLKLSDFMEK